MYQIIHINKKIGRPVNLFEAFKCEILNFLMQRQTFVNVVKYEAEGGLPQSVSHETDL